MAEDGAERLAHAHPRVARRLAGPPRARRRASCWARSPGRRSERPLVYVCGPTGFVEAVAEALVRPATSQGGSGPSGSDPRRARDARMEALDGNAIAGTLFEYFGVEMTTSTGVRPLRHDAPDRRARRLRARARHCGPLPPLRTRRDGPRPIRGDQRVDSTAFRMERRARRILKSDRRACGSACPPNPRHRYHEQYQSEPRSTDSTSNAQATTIQTVRARANRPRNSPKPGASVTTTTATATNPPSLTNPRLSRRDETSLGSGSGSATRDAPLLAAITGWSSCMSLCGDARASVAVVGHGSAHPAARAARARGTSTRQPKGKTVSTRTTLAL